ncbi:hypothetical protein NC651_007144 [Populus alba x Populus x berolinensis]|nr:hypothetical protein NC651_007144 [Populus alba x Populus x berolinensis]
MANLIVLFNVGKLFNCFWQLYPLVISTEVFWSATKLNPFTGQLGQYVSCPSSSSKAYALPFFGFSVAMFLFYSFVPTLLKISGSTMLNLSLLTSDMWAVVIRIFAYHEKVDWMYFVAFAAVAVGLIVYSGGNKEEDQHHADAGDEDAERSKHFDEEACSGNRGQKTIPGSSKTRDSSKHDLASTSIADEQDVESKNVGKDVWGKKS